MPREKFDYSSMKKLIDMSDRSPDFAEALQLLAADFFTVKSRLAESGRETAHGEDPASAEEVLQKASQDIGRSLAALEGISGKSDGLPANLRAAHLEMRYTKTSIDEALRHGMASSAHDKRRPERQPAPGPAASVLIPETA